MEEGRVWYPEEGTPQGGVISPLLANIYLHEVLDLWFEKEVRPRMKGRTRLIRYADDFVICFEREDDARKIAEVLPKRFAKRANGMECGNASYRSDCCCSCSKRGLVRSRLVARAKAGPARVAERTKTARAVTRVAALHKKSPPRSAPRRGSGCSNDECYGQTVDGMVNDSVTVTAPVPETVALAPTPTPYWAKAVQTRQSRVVAARMPSRMCS